MEYKAFQIDTRYIFEIWVKIVPDFITCVNVLLSLFFDNVYEDS